MSGIFSTAELSGEGNRESHMLVPLDLLHTNDHPPAALEILQQLGRVSDVKFGHALHGCYIVC